MGCGWAAESSNDGYGRWRKMKKLREMAVAGSSTMGKSSRCKGKEEGNDGTGVDMVAMIAIGKRGEIRQQRWRLWQRMAWLHGLVRLMIAAAKMVRNYNKVAEMTTEEDDIIGHYDMRLGATTTTAQDEEMIRR
ncbi:hypothetical protein B296_00025253 [Ensete ventricosum]|uniref:Uncharacterized protein n=1 Tax=Ensete ventricosum TaxID=4639 RepID=A0A426XP36_ENSVE|nr:hypothetical protein B296_00025253 [Ensete ventricosum]